jgi:molybdate transport system ATP-binding protein
LNRDIKALSMGEIRKVLITWALMKSPKLLILDEPFDGLDPPARNQLQKAIRHLMKQGVHVILVTHRPDEISPEYTHVLGLNNCRVVLNRPLKRTDPITLFHDLFHRVDPAPRPPDMAPQISSPSSPVLVSMKNVTVAYNGHSVLNQINWTVKKGENWMITGPNGSGKTTLLSLISGNHPQAYCNDISLFGRPRGSGESTWDIQSNIGRVSSEFQIRYQKRIPLADVVLSGFYDSVGLYRNPPLHYRAVAETWMKIFGIHHLWNKNFTMLSQGEQRLGLLARAMVKSPPLLILDEPCLGLDSQNREALLRVMDHVGLHTPTVLVYVTHHQDDRLSCITHILSLTQTPDGGYTAASGPPNAQAIET